MVSVDRSRGGDDESLEGFEIVDFRDGLEVF